MIMFITIIYFFSFFFFEVVESLGNLSANTPQLLYQIHPPPASITYGKDFT